MLEFDYFRLHLAGLSKFYFNPQLQQTLIFKYSFILFFHAHLKSHVSCLDDRDPGLVHRLCPHDGY